MRDQFRNHTCGAILCCCLVASSALAVRVTVPGTADPWLAGMPDGSTASRVDVAPAESPVLAAGLSFVSGDTLTFSASGGVGFGPSRPLAGPEGCDQSGPHATYAENGISALTAPYESLIGVFLGPARPDLSPAPSGLDFSTSASREHQILSPVLQQAFFMGDGFTGSTRQQIVVPNGATRLYLGTMDGWGWYNNIGSFSVEVTVVSTSTRPAIVPAVATNDGNEITAYSATLGGVVTNDGGEACEYRFCYGRQGEPERFTAWHGSVQSGSVFTQRLEGLNPATEYYFEAQARNSAGIGTGGQRNFTTLKTEFMVTLDDGPMPGATQQVLLELAHPDFYVDGNPLKAGFFLVGDNDPNSHPTDVWCNKGCASDPALYGWVRLLATGHVVGNHTQHHPASKAPDDDSLGREAQSEILLCQEAIRRALVPIGMDPPKLFRCPYLGEADELKFSLAARGLGYTVVGGSLVGDQWPWASLDQVTETAMEILRGWDKNEPAVLVFHPESTDSHGDHPVTYGHVGAIIRSLQKEGFTLAHFDPGRIPGQTSGAASRQVLSGVLSGPVDLIITDPEGLVLSKDQSQIPHAVYREADVDEDGDLDDFFVIPDPKAGPYLIQVIPEPNALPEDTYSVELGFGDRSIVLAKQMPVREIPAVPYSVTVKMPPLWPIGHSMRAKGTRLMIQQGLTRVPSTGLPSHQGSTVLPLSLTGSTTTSASGATPG